MSVRWPSPDNACLTDGVIPASLAAEITAAYFNPLLRYKICAETWLKREGADMEKDKKKLHKQGLCQNIFT